MSRLRTLGLAALVLLSAGQASALTCDLTGRWRSSLGALTLLQTPYSPTTDGTLSALEQQGPERPDAEELLLQGSFETASGSGQLVGSVQGDRLTFRWAAPASFAPPQEAGDAEATISVDCDRIEGKLRAGYAGAFDRAFVARRVSEAADTQNEGYAGVLAALDERLNASGAAHREKDRVDFDPGVLAERLGSDPMTLFAFVRDAIAYEPYSGVLRGASGTLIARAGNAADKALLLAELLRATGHEVRFAMARVGPDRLVSLLSVTAATQPLPAPKPVSNDTVLQAYGITAEELAVQEEARRSAAEALLQAVAAESDREVALLDELLPLSALTPTEGASGLEEAVANHVWVQVKTADGWVDLDASPLGAAGPVTAEQTMASLPAELYHVIEIMVFIEVSDGSTLTEHRVGGWSLAAADVMRVGLPSFRLINLPIDSTAELAEGWSVDKLRAAAQGMAVDWYLKAENFQPVLLLSTGETQIGQAFDLSGNLLSDDWQVRLAQNMQRVLEGGFGGLENALGGLMGGGEAPAEAQVTAQWYEFRLVAPDGSSRSQLRTVFDRLGPARRAAGNAALPEGAADDEMVRIALGLTTDFLITGGRVSPQFAEWRMVESFLANAPLLRSLVDLRFGRQSFSPSLFADALRYPNELLSFLAFQQALAAESGKTEGASLVQDRPHLLVLQQGVQRDEQSGLRAIRRFDLVEVGMAGLPAEGGSEQEVLAAQRRYGVAITVLERLLLPALIARECPGCALGEGVGTSAVFDAARAEGQGFAVLGPGDGESPSALNLNADLVAYLGDEVEAGRWIVLPRQAVTLNDVPQTGWWRIDPVTGETLGMMQSGAGEGYTEYIIVTGMIFFGGNVGAFLNTIVMSPFDDEDQSLFDVVTCAFVAAICPHLFGWDVPVDNYEEFDDGSAAGSWSCSVEDLIAGTKCAGQGWGGSSGTGGGSSGGTGGSAGGSGSGGGGHYCPHCGGSLPPRGGR